VVALINSPLPPSLRLPVWSGDVLAIWTAFFLVDNIDTAITLGQTSIGFAIRTEGMVRGALDSLLRFLLFPLLFCLGLWDYATGRMQSRYFRGTFRWQAGLFALVIAALIVLLFLNYQVMRRVG